MNTLPKHAPHAYAHARPWDRFKGKEVGRKEVSRKEIFVPGHKENVALESGLTSGGAYGAFAGGPPRASGIETSRRSFGAYAATEDARGNGGRPAAGTSPAGRHAADVLGPVDLAREHSRSAVRLRASKLEEPPPDTLRWNPEAQTGGGVGARRRHVNRLLEEENERQAAAQAAQAAQAASGDERVGVDGKTSAQRAAARRKDRAPAEDTLRMRAGRSEVQR